MSFGEIGALTVFCVFTLVCYVLSSYLESEENTETNESNEPELTHIDIIRIARENVEADPLARQINEAYALSLQEQKQEEFDKAINLIRSSRQDSFSTLAAGRRKQMEKTSHELREQYKELTTRFTALGWELKAEIKDETN